MRISIVTPVLNAQQTIADTLRSIDLQTYADVEHIIMDGGSTDSTIDVISRNSTAKERRVVRSDDEGIYDAMNKGIALASGEVVGILNADDFYASPRAIETVVSKFEQTGSDVVYGDVDIVYADNIDKVLRHWAPGPFSHGSFRRGWHPPHPAVFVRRSIYEKYGAFDLSFAIAADFEFLLRVFERYRVTVEYLPEVLTKMRAGGTSTKSIANMVRGNLECQRAFRTNAMGVPFFYPILRLVPKMGQFMAR